MSLNLSKIVINFLKDRPEEKFTAREIASWIFEKFPDACQQKRIRSAYLDTDSKLIQQIIAEIGAYRPRIQNQCIYIKTSEGRPRKYYFSTKTDHDEVSKAELHRQEATQNQDSILQLCESDLYPKLAQYLFSELKVYSKRIDEKRSSNNRGSGGNKWLYPDLVGIENLSLDWHREIKDCVHHCSDLRARLWSFEVKLLINRSNVREAFFQAVSNSTWAHRGYLVTADIQGPDTLKELQILAGRHGIGLIKLDLENPSESQILIPSFDRFDIDWNSANRLAEENKDFLEYIKLVRQFFQTSGDLHISDWMTNNI